MRYQHIEASNAGDTRNVTAFEIWLFDKNDTQTVTKVLMSDGAYNDDGIRAKLATRGELIMAELGRTIPLETASLIINAGSLNYFTMKMLCR